MPFTPLSTPHFFILPKSTLTLLDLTVSEMMSRAAYADSKLLFERDVILRGVSRREVGLWEMGNG